MQDISLHILDIAENSIDAGANKIKILINEKPTQNILSIKIQDNGKGLDKKIISEVIDPFYTTKESKRIGLGISLLAQATKESDGKIDIKSKTGKGTTITATFTYNHIDRKPIGDMSKTMIALLTRIGPDINIIYTHKKNGKKFLFDTREIKKKLKEVTIINTEVLRVLKENIRENLENFYYND